MFDGSGKFIGGGGNSDGGGGGGGDDFRNKEDHANSKDMFEWALSGGGKAFATMQKLFFGTIGISLGKFGRVGLDKALGGETEGLMAKTIMPSVLPNANGGKIAEIFTALLKNRAITDQTSGIGRLEWISLPESMLGALSPSAVGGRSQEISIA